MQGLSRAGMVKLVPVRRKWRQKRWERGRIFSLKTKEETVLGVPWAHHYGFWVASAALPPRPHPTERVTEFWKTKAVWCVLGLSSEEYKERASLNTTEETKAEPHVCLESESMKSSRHQGKWQYHLFCFFFEAKSPFPLWKLTLSALKVASIKLDLYHFSFQEGFWH